MSNHNSRLLELAPLALAGLMAGGALFISLIECPARLQLSPSEQVAHWRTTFPRAKSVFWPSGLLLVPMLCAAAHTTGNRLYYAGAACFGSLMPFTAIALMGVNRRLLTMEVRGKEEEEEAVKFVRKWGRRHFTRTLAMLSGFGICLYATLDCSSRK